MNRFEFMQGFRRAVRHAESANIRRDLNVEQLMRAGLRGNMIEPTETLVSVGVSIVQEMSKMRPNYLDIFILMENAYEAYENRSFSCR